MRASTLLYFFYGTGVPVAQTAPPKPVEDFSRGRWHAHAYVEPVAAIARANTRAWAQASVVVSLPPARARVIVGHTRVTAPAVVSLAPVSRQAVAKVLHVRATASQALAQARTLARVRDIALQADAALNLPAVNVRAILRAPSVSIGPDLVVQELEEIMFLLEVA